MYKYSLASSPAQTTSDSVSIRTKCKKTPHIFELTDFTQLYLPRTLTATNI